MAKLSNWLIGCGIGCGAVILVGVLLVVGGVLFIRDSFEGFNAAIDLAQAVDDRFGAPETFVPRPHGEVPAERMEVFLAVRQATQPSRAKIAAVFDSLPLDESATRELESKPLTEKLRQAFEISRSALGLGSELGDFFQTRNQALLDSGMGLGEYTYIYAVAYHAWLGHSPTDGPGSRIRVDVEGSSEVITPRSGHRSVVGRIHDQLLQILRNQLESLGEPGSRDERAWQEALRAEVARLEQDSARLPWQAALPEAIADSLEPYRERLEATYVPSTNAFELARSRRHGNFSIQSE